MTIYTAISFAPVQGFIEESRKLRDLYGASLMLSYLSQQIAKAAYANGFELISPAPEFLDDQEGMPNRILVKGDSAFERDDARQALLAAWTEALEHCRRFIEEKLGPKSRYDWEPEWQRWQRYAWELFWGQGASCASAMQDLERRKLKRDWTGINWTGNSSSLIGMNAIAWPQMSAARNPNASLTDAEEAEIELFYQQLAWLMDNPYQHSKEKMLASSEDWEAYAKGKEDEVGKYIAPNERISVPELVKRLVTWPKLAKQIGMTQLDEGFREVIREAGHWTGWFMGDGDRIGDHLNSLENDGERTGFSQAMRTWGRDYKAKFEENYFKIGRMIYAGGDDFLGVLSSPNKEKPLSYQTALKWLESFNQEWKQHGQRRKEDDSPITVSVGFVWAGHQVPQRDILQHCRRAQKSAKNAGRDRVAIRIVFNNGQHLEWICPWNYLSILSKYRDRDGITLSENLREEESYKSSSSNPIKPNWAHLYNDWAVLKARHAIRLSDEDRDRADERVGLDLFHLYFDNQAEFEAQSSKIFQERDTSYDVLKWLDDLVQVGWQLCSSS